MSSSFGLLLSIFSCLLIGGAIRAEAPRPRLPVPTRHQLEWQRCEINLFLYFGVNTFTDREWGLGTEDPKIFSPVNLGALQWARASPPWASCPCAMPGQEDSTVRGQV